jgi:protein-S-isoprenylcysteine O-methyltransferase Ste14
MNLIAVIPGTVIIIIFSWFLSIKHKRYHGIARFFSFESIFLTVLLNADIWFRNPFSVLQLISWILLVMSLYLAVAGFLLLKKIGKPAEGNFENTTVIVKTGLYRYIRHPLYLSLLLAGTGAMIKDPAITQLLLAIVNLVAIWITALIEEKEMIARFGTQYSEYIEETKMFIPFIL